ncbi:hypothetical protein BD560DRAFT_405269 [Blakeslea trispora]|nr:hypothetical protein BD560DRAFT_405269 [Blakeslea trispora]
MAQPPPNTMPTGQHSPSIPNQPNQASQAQQQAQQSQQHQQAVAAAAAAAAAAAGYYGYAEPQGGIFDMVKRKFKEATGYRSNIDPSSMMMGRYGGMYPNMMMHPNSTMMPTAGMMPMMQPNQMNIMNMNGPEDMMSNLQSYNMFLQQQQQMQPMLNQQQQQQALMMAMMMSGMINGSPSMMNSNPMTPGGIHNPQMMYQQLMSSNPGAITPGNTILPSNAMSQQQMMMMAMMNQPYLQQQQQSQQQMMSGYNSGLYGSQVGYIPNYSAPNTMSNGYYGDFDQSHNYYYGNGATPYVSTGYQRGMAGPYNSYSDPYDAYMPRRGYF